jgi:hypothetical protein
MTESQKSSNSWMWLSAAIVAILIVVILLVAVVFLSGSDDADVATEVTPVSGGAEVPTSLAELEATDSETEKDGTPEPLAVGTQVTSISASGDGTRLFSDADEDSLLMEILLDGDLLVIVEPSGDHDGYPAWNDESEWYRVRTSEGLVGWAKAEQLMPTE